MASAAVARSGTDYSVDVMTRVGHETYGRLEALGKEAVAGTEWRVVDTRVDPPRVAFESPCGRMEVALESVSSPGYLRTEEFSLVYRGVSRLEPEHVALLEQFASSLREVETDPKWLKAIRRPLLRRVSYFPADSRIEFRPNLACNHACPFCNSVDRTGADNVAGGADDLLAEMALWRSLPVSFVVISGGEPTLVKRLPELVETFADEGFGIELQTNGMAFDDPSYAARMAAAGVRRLLVSLHSADAERSDAEITFFPGGWERTVAGIDNALDAGIKVAISHVLHGANAVGLADFMRFVSARWGRRVTVRIAFVAPTGRARPGETIPALPDVLPAIRTGLGEARRLRVRAHVVAYCGVPPCLLEPYHRMTEVARTLGGRTFSDDHVKLPACRGCRYESKCPGIWSRYIEIHGDPGIHAM